MSKYVKNLVQSEFEKKLKGVTSFLVINTMGIGGIVNNQMRADLQKKGVRMLVVKNTLARKAFDAMGVKGSEAVLVGPCTLAFGGDSVVDVAKEMAEATKKIKGFEVRGAFVDGMALDSKGAIALAKMPNRRQLQAQVVSMILTPGSNVAAAIMAPARKVAGCVKTIVENGEKAEKAA